MALCWWLAGCGGDSGGGASTESASTGSASTLGTSSTTAASTTASTTAVGSSTASGTSGGNLGPTAQVRLVNLAADTGFSVWVADVDHHPVQVLDAVAYEAISDYFDVPLDQLSQNPTFNLLPVGEAPDDTPTWPFDNSQGADRALVQVTELDGAGQQATLVLDLTADPAQVEYETLDESNLMLGDPSMANLHVAWRLFDYPPPAVPDFAVAGQPCLFDTTGVPQPWSVAPGTFDVGVYDLQMVSDCSVALGTTSITAAAGDQVLLAVYHVDADVRFLQAPIVAP